MQWKVIMALFIFCVSVSNFSCSDGNENTDGDLDQVADGDIDIEVDDDIAENESEVEDETDGDTLESDTIEDGDSENDTETETQWCDNPFDIPTEKWQPQNTYVDVPYVQEQGKFVESGLPEGSVNALTKANTDEVYAATDNGIFKVDENRNVTKLDSWNTKPYEFIVSNTENLYAISGTELFIGNETESSDSVILEANPLYLGSTGNNEVWLVTDDGKFGQVSSNPLSVQYYGDFAAFSPNSLCVVGTKVYLAANTGLWEYNLDDSTATSLIANENNWPATNLTSVVCNENGPSWVSIKDNGVAKLSGDNVEFFDGSKGLPYMSVNMIVSDHRLLFVTDPVSPAVEENKREMPTGFGLITFDTESSFWDYYNSQYWIKDNIVNDTLMTDPQHIFVATSTGLSIITATNITLEEKAEVLDLGQYERHNRFGMFSKCFLSVPGDLSSSYLVDDDNDGQWTNQYLASQSFRYAVTGSETAKQYADEAANAMVKLLTITGKKGFFARSIVEPVGDDKTCPPLSAGEWHLSEDELWCWKGDTSKDEYVGHIFGLSLYYDLVADDAQKKKVRDAFVDLHDGMIDVGYYMEDVDGECTSHGQFDPQFMQIIGIFGDAGLNAASILGGLLATYRMSGEQRFMDAFNYLAFDEGYADYVRRIEEINLMVHINHDAEEMSFIAMATLMRYETDPCLMAMWREGLEYLWEVQRTERNPEFNMIYAWLSRNETNDLGNSIKTLQGMQMDGIKWEVLHSHRADYTLNPKIDRHGDTQSFEVFPYKQKLFPRWSENPYRLDFNGHGTIEEMLQPWLLPYWLGRYAGIIIPEEN